VNLATGGVNKQLIQRIGRVLRNPDGEKEAVFVNLVGVQTDPEAQVPAEDGKRLIEEAHQFRLFGDRFQNEPWFDCTTTDVGERLTPLLEHGYERITTLIEEDCYDWPRNEEAFEELLSTIKRHDSRSNSVLEAWGASPSEENVRKVVSGRKPRVKISVEDAQGTRVSGAFVSICTESETDYGKTDSGGSVTLEYTTETDLLEIGVRHPNAGVRFMTKSAEDKDAIETMIKLPQQSETASGTGS
ncbi:MAG: hypothetical protein ABEI52_08130, partial [Halobacteriaceae archaeon]